MTGRRVEKFARLHLLPYLPGFTVRGSLIYATPVGEMLTGFAFGSSRWDKNSILISLVAQPLCWPFGHVTAAGEVQDRRRGPWIFARDWWQIPDEADPVIGAAIRAAMIRQGLPFLRRRSTLEGFVRWGRITLGPRGRDHAFALARLGCYREAAWLLKRETTDYDDVVALREALAAGPETTARRLAQWEREMRVVLKLD